MEYLALPVINAATLDQSDTLLALDSACRKWGAFQLVGHSITGALRTELLNNMRNFFAQPAQLKQQVERSQKNPWGFYGSELTRNTRDWKEVYDYGPAHAGTMRPQWPDLEGFQSATSNYYRACEALAFEILEAVSATLGAGPGQTGRCFRPDHSSFLRLNYYPRCERPAYPEGNQPAEDGFLGVNPHTDAGAITLLLQDDQPGLELYSQNRWHRVEGGSLVVHLGDIFQVWSNDRYPAPIHRVAANSEAERLSAPFFFNPAYETVYQPLQATIDQHNPARYRPINWGEFRNLRAAGDYADYIALSVPSWPDRPPCGRAG